MKLSLRSLVLSAALFLGGCIATPGLRYPQNAPRIVLHGDTRFPSEMRSECFQWAANKWSEQTSGNAAIGIAWDYDASSVGSKLTYIGSSRLAYRTSDEEWTKDADSRQYDKCVEANKGDGSSCSKVILGNVEPAGGVKGSPSGTVTVNIVYDRINRYSKPIPDGSLHTCRLIALHEFGHALGTGHVFNPTAIMNPSINGDNTECLKSADLTAYCIVNPGYCGPTTRLIPCANVPELDNGITITELKDAINDEAEE